MKTLLKKIWKNLKAFAFNSANSQWFIALLFVLFGVSLWFYGGVLSAVTGPLLIVLLFWFGLVKMKFVEQDKEEE